MLSVRSPAIAAVAAAAVLIICVNGHGYMLIPETQFSGTATGAWVVQIDPQWESSDWNGNTQQSVEAYKTLAAANGVTEIRSLLDDTSIYGADCGLSDPNGEAQAIPTDSTATFERAIQHVGPCEIWLDDTMVFHEDDCYSTYGNEDYTVKSVFPVDYSQCETSGCSQMRFYWLAFQGISGETVWQVYKDCIPLVNSGSTTSTSTASTDDTANESDTTATTTTTTSPTTTTTAPTTTTTAPATTTATPSSASTSVSDTTEAAGTVQPSSSSTSGNWGNWGGSWGNWGGNWGSRQLRA